MWVTSRPLMWCCIPEQQRTYHSRPVIWEMPGWNVCWSSVCNKCDFPQFLQAYVWIGQEYFIPNDSQYTIHFTILCHIMWDADSIIKYATAKDLLWFVSQLCCDRWRAMGSATCLYLYLRMLNWIIFDLVRKRWNWGTFNILKADSHIACHAHAVPLPCHAAKGLECVFPIWFTQCLIHTCHAWAHALLWPCRSSQGHGTSRPSRDSL